MNSLDVDEDTRVVYFGECGAFSEQAMLEYFGDKITAFNKTTFRDVIETVANGEAKYGVVPIENTSTGSITDIYDLLVEHDITIVAEHVVKVEQALLGVPGAKTEDIKEVYSHPQGLLQCAPFLEEHGIQGIEYASTAGAAKKVAEEYQGSRGVWPRCAAGADQLPEYEFHQIYYHFQSEGVLKGRQQDQRGI